MRRNTHLIDRSELLRTIVEKIEACYAEDISLLICYGSYITGDYGALSDIDFFFVPKTEKGRRLGYTFILKDIGYDLWPVSWARLTNISNLEEQIASILMDGAVLFASSEADLLKLEELKDHLRQGLNDESAARKASLRYVDRAKAIYFDMQGHESDQIFIDAVKIAENLLFAIAILNGTYTRKGLKKLEDEAGRFSVMPDKYLEIHGKLIKTKDRAEVRGLAQELIVDTEKTWKRKFDPEEENPDASELAEFYEEVKSTYNKLLLACDAKNYENAYYAGFMLDRDTQSFLKNFTGPGVFPNMIEVVLGNDFEAMRAACLEHERRLVDSLNEHHIHISKHSDMDEFRRYFLERTA